jgi:hypothetical protein
VMGATRTVAFVQGPLYELAGRWSVPVHLCSRALHNCPGPSLENRCQRFHVSFRRVVCRARNLDNDISPQTRQRRCWR